MLIANTISPENNDADINKAPKKHDNFSFLETFRALICSFAT